MSSLAKAAYFARTAAGGFRRAPLVHSVAVLALAVALFVAGLTRGGLHQLDAVVAQLSQDVELTVYLEPGLDGEAAAALARSYAEESGATARVVSPREALERLSLELGERAGALQGLQENPLPTSVELSWPHAPPGGEWVRRFAAELRVRPQVQDVDFGEEAVERVSAVARAATAGAWVAFAVVCAAAVVIVSATLQLAIYARRHEIEIQKLVGATDRFVRAPFLLEGALQGLAGAALSVGGLWLFAQLAAPRLSQWLAFLTPLSPDRAWLRPTLLLELAAAGAGLGLVGSLIAVRRFLRA